MISLMVLNLIYGSMFSIAKFGLTSGQPVFSIGLKAACGGIISLMIYLLVNHYRPLITKKEWVLLLMLSIFNVYLANVLEIIGLQNISVGKAAFIYNITPFISALFGYIIFHERMTFYKWGGLFLGFSGFIPLFADSLFVENSAVISSAISPELMVCGAAVASIIGWTTMKFILQNKSLSPFLCNGISLVLGSLFCFMHAYFFETQPYIRPGHYVSLLITVCIVGIIKFGTAYNLNSFLLIRYTTTLVVFFGFTASLFAGLLGILLFGEPLTFQFIIAVILVSVGLFLFYYEEFSHI